MGFKEGPVLEEVGQGFLGGLHHAGQGLIRPVPPLHDIARHVVVLGTEACDVVAFGLEYVEDPRGGARLVVVVHEDHPLGPSIRGPVAPVVDHVVADVQVPCMPARLVEPARQAPVPARAVGQQVMVEGPHVPAYARRIPVAGARCVVGVPGHIEGLRDQGSLKCDIAGPSRAKGLVLGPADGAVVQDAVVATGQTHTVHGLARQVAQAEADVADDGVPCAKAAEGVVAHADPLARRSLACHGQEGVSEHQPALQGDQAAHVEHHGPGTVRLHGLAEAARPAVVEVGHVQDLPGPPPEGKPAVALGLGEGQVADTEGPDIAGRDMALRVDLIHSPAVGQQAVTVRDVRCAPGRPDCGQGV